MTRLLLMALLVGCGAADDPALPPPDPDGVPTALAAAQPEPLVDLVEDTRELVPGDGLCPLVEVDGPREIWTGGCVMDDGAVVEGVLSRYDGPEGLWIAAEGFSVRAEGELIFAFDGAVETFGEGDLLYVDAAASLCGVGALGCEDGPWSLDLAFSLYPFGSYPAAYDATVSGVIALPGEASTAVEGTWSVDAATCAAEATSGQFALRHRERHAIELNGASSCDGCAAWFVQGVEVGQLCGLGR